MDGLKTLLPKRLDFEQVALEVVHSLDTMQPMDVPPVPQPSAALQKALDKKPPESVPEDLELELQHFANARMARANARGENVRRLRSLLWAEQYLRVRGRQEHELVRAFNREVWGVCDAASSDIAEREAQVNAHA